MDIESAAGFRFKGPELATVQGILKDAPCCERCKSRYEARSARWGCATGIGALLGGLAVAFFSVRATYWADHSASLFEKIAGTIFGGGLVFVLAAAASAAAVVALRLVIAFPQRVRVNSWLARWRIT